MTESLLDKFNKGIQGSIQLTQEEMKTLETMGIEDINDIDRIGFVETLQEVGKSLLGYLVGKPAKTVKPVVESGLVVLSDFEKGLEKEIESVETGRDAIEYARRAIIRSRLRKQTKDVAQLGARQIEYIASATETTMEPYLDSVENPLAESAVALIDDVSNKGLRVTQNVMEGISETTTEALEIVKNIPSTISSYAKKTYDNVTLWSSRFWSFVDSASDFFYVMCALILLGKFDFLLKNTYLVILVTVVIVYTINRT